MERFELSRVKDFKANIIKYIEVQMAHQQQVKLWIYLLIYYITLMPLHFSDYQLLGGIRSIRQRNRLTSNSIHQMHFQNVYLNSKAAFS